MFDPISLLLLSPKWQFDTYGVSSVIRSLANDLWLTDPEGKRIQMTCAVLQEDGKINQKDVEDAKKHNVTLRGVQFPRGTNELPTAEDLDVRTVLYYKHLVRKHNYDFIIGHIPYLANAALNLRDFCRDLETHPKVILLAHSLPKRPTGDINDDLLLEWLGAETNVVSIGKGMKNDIESYIGSLQEADRPAHTMYFPGCPAELLTIMQEERTSSVTGPQNIAVMTTEKKNLDISGLDYPLAVSSSTITSDNVHTFCGIQAKVQFLVLASNATERDAWKTSFNEIKEKQTTKDKRMTFQFHSIENLEKLKSIMRRTTVMLLPLKADSPLFGVEALMAAYSGEYPSS